MARLQKLNKEVTILKELDESASDGQLRKWHVEIDGKWFYLKASSISNNTELFECESECISCRIAKLLGLQNIVWYDFDYLETDEEIIKVCISEDFVLDADFYTYKELMPDITRFYEKEKYDKVISFNPELKEYIDKILFFDAIIYNKDRHLNNLAILNDENGEMIVPLFDNGDSLYSKLDVQAMKMDLKMSFGYQKCRPFYKTVRNQLSLIGEVNLNQVNINDVYEIVDEFLTGKRAKYVKQLLRRNLSELKLIKRE